MIFLQNMRMSCNSTYLLDPETDYGVKAEELINLLSDLLEDPGTKVVIFSQWVRMHRLVAMRLKARKWGHVLFSGEVPGPKRKELIHRFREDRDCRLFLSTDAGGVGLNLQHASVVVNLDQPWNPAVLEQRIGRVHRLGQHRPVRVLHLISQGTIEEGMLNVLRFKKAVFAGVLDGGQNEVFLGGTRLKQFMESVEKATTAIPRPMPWEQPGGNGHERGESVPDGRGRQPGSRQSPKTRSETGRGGTPAETLWTDVLSAGASLLDKLAQALGVTRPGERSAGGGSPLPPVSDLVVRDSPEEPPYLKLPLPKPEVVEQIAGLLNALLGR